MPAASICRPDGRVAERRPQAKVSNHSLLLEPLTLPLPSLKICLPMCGPTVEPKLTPHLDPDNDSSYPDDLEPGGWPNQGPAGDQGQQMSLLLRA